MLKYCCPNEKYFEENGDNNFANFNSTKIDIYLRHES